jgi:anti-sigma factor ChrR (cupin superfamily)
MTLHDNAYASFMLDYAAGLLSPAEKLAADLHRALSTDGARTGRMMDALGGALLERVAPAPTAYFDTVKLEGPPKGEAGSSNLDPFLKRDLVSLKWNKNIVGVKTLPTGVPMASLLRLDPGERAPAHGHGRRDVTVVLCGTYADEFGVYERGDLAFAEPGLKHKPRAVGDKICVCLLATESGKPLRGFFGMFAIGGPRRAAS